MIEHLNRGNIVKKPLTLALAVSLTLPLLVANEAQLSNMAKDLVEKRSLVDEISTELDIKKSEIKTLQSSSAVQMTDLQRLIKAEEIRIGKFDQDIDKLEKKLRTQEVPTDKIKPILLKSLDSLERTISSGIPFKKTERIAEVKNLREMIVNSTMIPEKGLSKVWSMLESEFRLTRENGLYRQNIEKDGKIHLADIVKVGMTKMFFKVSEDHLGEVVKNENDYVYAYASNKEDKDHLNQLFDDFQKKIRTGYFMLPKI
jgi:hypothetical protein